MSASQADLWSGPVGHSWVRNAVAYDRILEPLGLAALDRLDLGPGQRVLDIGCGTGTTTLEIARRVLPGGSVVGADVSRPMVEFARGRLTGDAGGNVEFTVLDAENDPLPGPFDAAFSRMGVMFFDDPRAAFANIARSLTAGGRLAFVCFRSPLDNPFISVPTGAALVALGGTPGPPPPGVPGPFSLADPDLVRAVLESAGFQSVAVNPGPDEVTLGPADQLDDLARQAVEQNPQVMMAMAAHPDAREAAIAAAAAALRDHVVDGMVRPGAGTWIVEARAPHAVP